LKTTQPCQMCSRWENELELRIIDFEHSYLTLNRDQFFPGYCLLFTKQHLTELFHLDPLMRQGLMEEVTRSAAALAQLFNPDKINYELLGNMVPHIHWHIVPRFNSDPLWPRPIWSEPHNEKLLEPIEYVKLSQQIRQSLEQQ